MTNSPSVSNGLPIYEQLFANVYGFEICEANNKKYTVILYFVKLF